LMRFIAGARYAARSVTRAALAHRSRGRNAMPGDRPGAAAFSR
jgi:hypothetical protein